MVVFLHCFHVLSLWHLPTRNLFPGVACDEETDFLQSVSLNVKLQLHEISVFFADTGNIKPVHCLKLNVRIFLLFLTGNDRARFGQI